MHALDVATIVDGADVGEAEVDLVDYFFHGGNDEVDKAVARVGAFAHYVGFEGDEAGIGGSGWDVAARVIAVVAAVAGAEERREVFG